LEKKKTKRIASLYTVHACILPKADVLRNGRNTADGPVWLYFPFESRRTTTKRA